MEKVRPYRKSEVFVHEDDEGRNYISATVLVPKGRYLLVRYDDAIIARAVVSSSLRDDMGIALKVLDTALFEAADD